MLIIGRRRIPPLQEHERNEDGLIAWKQIQIFYLGVYLSKRPEVKVFKGWMGYLLAAAGVCIVRHGDVRDIPLLGMGTTLAASLLVLSFFVKDGAKAEEEMYLKRLLRFLGGYAMEIYVLHTYVIAACRAFLPVIGAWILKRIGLHAYFFRPAQTILRRDMVRRRNNDTA